MCTPAGPGTVKELRADLCGAVLWRRYVGVDDTPRKLRLHGRVGAGGVRGLSRRSVHGQPQAEGRRLFARGVFGSVSDAESRDQRPPRWGDPLPPVGRGDPADRMDRRSRRGDRPLALQNWENSRRTGTSFDIEYRLRTAAGGFRWHLVRATPMRDSAGTIVKWFGACTDIDDQMRHQEV